MKLTNEKKVNEAELKKKIGILCYLENLRKDGSSTPICPVCRNDLIDKVTLLTTSCCSLSYSEPTPSQAAQISMVTMCVTRAKERAQI